MNIFIKYLPEKRDSILMNYFKFITENYTYGKLYYVKGYEGGFKVWILLPSLG